MASSSRIQIQVDPFTEHVLEKLVGIKGRNKSDVAYFIFRQWISDHHDELSQYGIRAQVDEGMFEPPSQ